MRKHVWYGIAIVMAAALTLFGTGYAGWFGSDDETKSESQTPGAAGEREAMPQADQVTLSGTINAESQLVSDQGEAFELANTEEGQEVKSLTGKKVEITGTVMEEAGQKIVEVHEYKILEE
jgi:hypothetical protein